MSAAFFVTGTAPGAGKTFASVVLLHALRQRGLRAVGAAFDAKLVPAAGDRHIEFRFDLPEVRIERTGDVGEVVVVHVRSERQDLLRC